MSNSRAKNVWKYVLPAMLSHVCFSLFSIVDGVFVGNGVGTNALGAIGLVMPFVNAVCALMMLINVGGATIFAVQIGKGDTDGANKVFRHGILLLVGVSALFCFAGVFFTDAICTMLGAGETFHEMAAEYLFWYSIFIIPSGLNMGLQSYCRNDGAPGLVAASVVVSTACNIVGDWLLIYPIPWGMKGAAIATGASQLVACLVMLTHFVRKKGILRFGKIKLSGGLVRDIIIHGLPEGVSQLSTPITSLCMNLVLVNMIGDIAVNAYSVITYAASFFFGVIFGTGEGLQPLLGQSYGAQNEADLKYYFKSGLRINFLGSALVALVYIVFGRLICTLFGADVSTLDYTVSVLPMYCIGFIVMALNTMLSAYLYSTERSNYATVISVLRSIAVNAAVILILPRLFGAASVWLTFAVYEAIVLVVAVVIVKHSERNGIIFK